MADTGPAQTHDQLDGGWKRGPEAWSRYLARAIDGLVVAVIALPLFLAIGVAAVFLPTEAGEQFFAILEHPLWSLLFGLVVSLPVALAFEALCLSRWGFTPGKRTMGITVSSQGAPPSFGTAFRRTVLVWTVGLGLGLPLISLATQIAGLARLEQEGVTFWDQGLGTTVSKRPVAAYRWVIGVVAWLIAVAITGASYVL